MKWTTNKTQEDIRTDIRKPQTVDKTVKPGR